MRATRAALGCLLLSGGACVTATAQTHSMGTLVSCPSDRAAPCLWAGENGQVIDTHALRSRMLATNSVGNLDAETAARNLERHMTYLENVHRYAQSVGHEFSYKMGVNERHLSDSSKRAKLPEMFVHQEMRAAKAAAMRRRLMTAATMSSSSSSTNTSEFNWCNTENPKGRSVCSAVKSQQNCGSCWAFAAADAIETAVAIAANQTTAVALSPQQFLSCSTRETEQTFEYCWATSGVSGVTWLSDSIKWKSTNNGCDGGMTHGAFMDAAQLHFGLVTELEMPYSDSSGSSGSNQTCVTTSNETAASITDWTQIVGKDCSVSSDPNVLLRNALQDQPIAVALNSEDPFKDYSGGFYSCPNDGVLSSKDDINHALLLVGYGTDATSGDYWILKNSYGTSWGDKGYLKLLADSKANCGLNIFPVIPLGATAGVATATVDGGGAKKFLGLSPGAWIALAVVLSVVTIILTAIGVWYSSKKRAALREQNSGAIYLSQTPQHTDGATF